MEPVMTVASIKGRHQNDEEGSAARRGEEKKEYVKRWRGFEFFLRFESHKITKTHGGPALVKGQALPQAQGQPVAEVRLQAMDMGDPGPDTTQTTTKIVTVACGVVPPPRGTGQDPA